MAKSKNLVIAKYYHDWGEHYYGLAADMEDDKAPQTKIDASWRLAAANFWVSLTLGGEQAPFWLFKCFRQGVGVEKDPYIRDLMYGAALKLTPGDVKSKVKPENKPTIHKSMQPPIDALVKLVKDTKKQLPKEGVDAAVSNDQLTKFNHAIKLPGGKLIQSCFTEKSTAQLLMMNMGHLLLPMTPLLTVGCMIRCLMKEMLQWVERVLTIILITN